MAGPAGIPAFSRTMPTPPRGSWPWSRRPVSPVWLSFAEQLLDVVLARFAAPDGGFYDTADDETDQRLAGIRRPHDPTDNATPSGWTAAAGALLSYAAHTGSEPHRTAAEGARVVHRPAARRVVRRPPDHGRPRGDHRHRDAARSRRRAEDASEAERAARHGRAAQPVPRGHPRAADRRSPGRPSTGSAARWPGVSGVRRPRAAVHHLVGAGDDPAAPARAAGAGHAGRAAGVARSRAHALAWCVRLVGPHDRRLAGRSCASAMDRGASGSAKRAPCPTGAVAGWRPVRGGQSRCRRSSSARW